jgi:hypothetical protein
MAGSQDIPDLKVFLCELLGVIRLRHPKIVLESDINRISSAENVLLVSSRVAAQIAMRCGVTASDIATVVKRARPSASQDAMSAMTEQVALKIEDGVAHPWKVMSDVDKMLASADTANKVPAWFKDELYPGIVRRAASGAPPTTREIEIMRYQVSTIGEW